MPDTDQRRAELSVTAEISNAIVRIVHDYTGRGPTMAKTSIRDNLVTVLMGETMLKAERRLVERGEIDVVMQMRRRFQQTMKDDMVEAVGELTGRRVRAFMSDNHLDPDLAIEVFVLEPEDAPVSENGRVS